MARLQWHARAARIFPGEKWTRGPLATNGGEAFPTFLARGEGARVWDTDGREFLDYLCGFGTNVLGYGNPRVELAATAAAKEYGGQLLTGPTPLSVRCAERMVTLRPGATWGMFAKNGSDVTTLARVAARASTERRYILRESHGGHGAYHGSTPQWANGKPGVLAGEGAQYELSYTYNDAESVQAAIHAADGDVAAIFVGGASYPYSSPTRLPTPGFARSLRQLADEAGALLVLDEIRTNFRVGNKVIGGSWHELGGGAPDMWCMSKAIANGHPLAVLLGGERARKGAASMMATGTFWVGAPPLAAAMATIDALEENDCGAIRHIQTLGRQLGAGLTLLAERHGLKATVSGPPGLPLLTFDKERPGDRPYGEQWCAAMAAGGVWTHPHHNWYISASHTKEDVRDTLRIADDAFEVVADSWSTASRASR